MGLRRLGVGLLLPVVALGSMLAAVSESTQPPVLELRWWPEAARNTAFQQWLAATLAPPSLRPHWQHWTEQLQRLERFQHPLGESVGLVLRDARCGVLQLRSSIAPSWTGLQGPQHGPFGVFPVRREAALVCDLGSMATRWQPRLGSAKAVIDDRSSDAWSGMSGTHLAIGDRHQLVELAERWPQLRPQPVARRVVSARWDTTAITREAEAFAEHGNIMRHALGGFWQRQLQRIAALPQHGSLICDLQGDGPRARISMPVAAVDRRLQQPLPASIRQRIDSHQPFVLAGHLPEPAFSLMLDFLDWCFGSTAVIPHPLAVVRDHSSHAFALMGDWSLSPRGEWTLVLAIDDPLAVAELLETAIAAPSYHGHRLPDASADGTSILRAWRFRFRAGVVSLALCHDCLVLSNHQAAAPAIANAQVTPLLIEPEQRGVLRLRGAELQASLLPLLRRWLDERAVDLLPDPLGLIEWQIHAVLRARRQELLPQAKEAAPAVHSIGTLLVDHWQWIKRGEYLRRLFPETEDTDMSDRIDRSFAWYGLEQRVESRTRLIYRHDNSYIMLDSAAARHGEALRFTSPAVLATVLQGWRRLSGPSPVNLEPLTPAPAVRLDGSVLPAAGALPWDFGEYRGALVLDGDQLHYEEAGMPLLAGLLLTQVTMGWHTAQDLRLQRSVQAIRGRRVQLRQRHPGMMASLEFCARLLQTYLTRHQTVPEKVSDLIESPEHWQQCRAQLQGFPYPVIEATDLDRLGIWQPEPAATLRWRIRVDGTWHAVLFGDGDDVDWVSLPARADVWPPRFTEMPAAPGE